MKFKFISKEKINKLPRSPGVYCFKNKEIFYIGKAANIKERVRSHFSQLGFKENVFLEKTKKIGFLETDSEIEALILEANLIKKYQPKYNVVWRDDKNYFFVGITKEDFPKVFVTHQTKKFINSSTHQLITYVGPFVDGKALKQTLKILRKIFPYRSCKNIPKRPCLWYHLGRCPAPCLIKTQLEEKILFDRIKGDCQRNTKNLFKILQGEKIQVLKDLRKEMKKASKFQDFERAAKIRDQILAFRKILAHSKIFEPSEDLLIQPWLNYRVWKKIEKKLKKILKIKGEVSRIEAYDVSNIQGQEATGSMVAFIDGEPAKNFYRRFKIKIEGRPNDIAMLKEVLSRRFNHPEWPFPDLILIDGGKAQLNAALEVLNQYESVKSALISVLALAKKRSELFIENGKNPILLKTLPREIFNLILQLKDEAHRFAITYHQKLRKKKLFD